MATKEDRGQQRYIDHLLKVTFRICHWNEEGALIGRSSGFMYKKNENSPILVITAGHNTPPDGSFIETSHMHNGQTAALLAGHFNVFYEEDGIDYAYSILPVETIQKSLENDMAFEFKVYNMPFVKAVKDEAYGFAVKNNYEFVRSGNTLVLPQYLCTELYLTLDEQDEHINYFLPSRTINTHEYYRGASGSPIADVEGRICSILIGGTEPRKHLKGFRLDNIELP
ncbi:MAG: hypothetical protein JSS76_00620 [Bacteroidetes bacterium]|nr:hypothetical protein [Bacteroidota bacterium]